MVRLPAFPDDPADFDVYCEWGKRVTIRELIDEQRRCMRSPNPVERFASALLIPGELLRHLRQLRNFDIGQLLENEVLPNLNILAPELTICTEAANRLRRPALSKVDSE